MKRLVVDLDGTLTIDDKDLPYASRRPRADVIARLREYRAEGYEIVIATARQMNTFAGNIGKINKHTLPDIIVWLNEHAVPFDEIYVGKPWCGHDGFYVDDRAIRPSEFVRLGRAELAALIDAERTPAG